MKTPIEVRVKYKLDTGEYAIHPNAGGNKSSHILGSRGRYKYAYGRWMEEQLENWRQLRDDFQKFDPTWCAVHDERHFPEWPTQKYMEWLEQKMIEKQR